MSTQIIRRPYTIAPELANLSPLLQRIYAARHVQRLAELDYQLSALPRPEQLKGLEAALELLQWAVLQQQRILIVGDFDADGATSCALAVSVLRALGADVDYLVPDRFVYGYGLSPQIVQVAAERQPQLLITVDNGIASLEGVALARQLGIKVLITDHHLPAAELPEAEAIVNPNQPGCAFPSKHLAGVGVIFYLLTALRSRLREHGHAAAQRINMADYLDLVALGTVADVVVLDQLNRTLVAQGLQRIQRQRARPGILALLQVAGRSAEQCSATDLGFTVGPRLNAAGRLQDMRIGIECLLSQDSAQALRYASELDRFNRERRDIEADMQTQALLDLDALHQQGQLPFGLCLYNPDWHQGVIGILAARVRERIHRPVIAFAPDQPGWLKGSARSVTQVHIRDALDHIASTHPGLIAKFGGHAQAAGLSLAESQLATFQQAFDQEVRRTLQADDLRGCLYSDGELSAAELNLDTVTALEAAGPWGQGFAEPLFDGEFRVKRATVLKGEHLKLELEHKEGLWLEGIAFRQAQLHPESISGQVQVAYRLQRNLWQGRARLQLVIQHLKILS